MLERCPFPKNSPEGRLRRQLRLIVEGLALPKPSHVLEDVTRHHLLTAHFPLEGLHGHETLDTKMAAYIDNLTAMEPDRIS